ncbi:MAG: ketol-acid reductoisomerase [Deltaproteobacteria bacterium]|nr:ketol-acid reductoisomerase [Deltaproteobacteria bacterium]
MRVLTLKDASLAPLKGVPIAVIGYGAQGRAQALCFKDSGLQVVVGVREGGPSWNQAKQDGLRVASIAEAAREAELIHVLIPDECHKDVYDREIAPHVTQGKTLSFSHGFSVVYGRISPPAGVDVILVAPKAPGTEERKAFLQGFGVPGLIAVRKNESGGARDKALALAHAMGLTRAGVLECTFEEETYEDLFGEQAVLCGGVSELVKAGFETLVEAGFPPEMAYFECLHELKLIVDLMYEGGLTRMWDVVSNTAEYGGRTLGPKVIGPEVRERMRELLKDVQTGEFAKRWVAEYEAGLPNLRSMRKAEAEHPIEVVGRQVRSLFQKKVDPAAQAKAS